MIKNTKRIIFTIIMYVFIFILEACFSVTEDTFAAESGLDQDYRIEGNSEVIEESKEETKEETEQVYEIRPSEKAFVNIELIEKLEKSYNAGRFMLNFELGNELINGVEQPAIADILYIEDLNFSFPLEKTNSLTTKFELSGLENKRYRYYIKSMQNLEYEGYFEVNFVEVKPQIVFKGFPKKVVFEGTKVALIMNANNVENEMIFNSKAISGKEIDEGWQTFKFVVSKNGNYKYMVKTGENTTKGVLKIDFFKNIKTNLDVPFNFQHPDYPEGCESYATVMVLKYFGYNIKESEFISKYLDIISLRNNRVTKIKNIFDKYYLGDPSNKKHQGYLANPPVLVNAVNKYFKKIKSNKYTPVNTTGKKLKNLLENEVLNNNPVVIWLTIENKTPYKAKIFGIPYVYPSHTLVISGYDRKKNMLYLTDSISGKRTVSYDVANKLYKLTGKKSFILRKV